MTERKAEPFHPYKARALLHGKHEDGTRGYPEVVKVVTVLSRKRASKSGPPALRGAHQLQQLTEYGGDCEGGGREGTEGDQCTTADGGGVMSSDRRGMLIAHGVDPQRWAKRYGIEPFEWPCQCCGRERSASVPFARGRERGLCSPPCICGDDSGVPYCTAWETMS